MNQLRSTITAIHHHEQIASIEATYQEQRLRIITLQPPGGLAVGDEVLLLIHETKPFIILNPCEGIGVANLLKGSVDSIVRGELLSRVIVRVQDQALSVLIDTPTAQALLLTLGDNVALGIKATDIAIEVNR